MLSHHLYFSVETLPPPTPLIKRVGEDTMTHFHDAEWNEISVKKQAQSDASIVKFTYHMLIVMQIPPGRDES